MQPMRYLIRWLEEHASSDHYLFTLQDLRALFPDMSRSTFRTLLSRTVRAGYLDRVCRGVYLHKKNITKSGLLLYHIAALLRANVFNYISLETALSDAGVISQIPMNWITVMSSGRSSIISCGEFGSIEYVHTSQKPEDLVDQLSYDSNCKLWRASVPQALRDMKITHRNCDLIDWNVANEFI